MLDRPAPGCNTITDLPVLGNLSSRSLSNLTRLKEQRARRRRLWNVSPPPFANTLLLSSMHAYQAKPSPSPTKLIPSRLALLLCIRGGVQARATLSAVHLLVRGAEVPLADVDIPRRQDTGRGA
jgi:hypothetical protein